MGMDLKKKCQHGGLPSIYEVEYNHAWGYIGKLCGVNMQKNTNVSIWMQFDVDVNIVIILSVHVQTRPTKLGIVCYLVI